jgi:hypothetical protein
MPSLKINYLAIKNPSNCESRVRKELKKKNKVIGHHKKELRGEIEDNAPGILLELRESIKRRMFAIKQYFRRKSRNTKHEGG